MSKSTSSGFTLIEVVLAVVLLGTALAIILGLQSSAVTQTVRNRNKEFALLEARKVLAFLEANEAAIQDTNDQKPLLEMLKQYDGKEAEVVSKEETQRLAPFQAHLTIIPWDIPDVGERMMRKITLEVEWTSSPLDRVQLVYFIPLVKKELGVP